jgi:hypothetical protein
MMLLQRLHLWISSGFGSWSSGVLSGSCLSSGLSVVETSSLRGAAAVVVCTLPSLGPDVASFGKYVAVFMAMSCPFMVLCSCPSSPCSSGGSAILLSLNCACLLSGSCFWPVFATSVCSPLVCACRSCSGGMLSGFGAFVLMSGLCVSVCAVLVPLSCA